MLNEAEARKKLEERGLDIDGLTLLCEPFPESAISYVPRITCKQCREAKGNCHEHPRVTCDTCGKWMTPRHIDLDYVGHAWVRERLIAADPGWTWEPYLPPDGTPWIVFQGGSPVGMWIILRICGTTMIGYGSCEPDKSDAIKELIGDAIRNAAMSRGVALDLWKKDRGPGESSSSFQRPSKSESPARTPTTATRPVAPEQAQAQQTQSTAQPDNGALASEAQCNAITKILAKMKMEVGPSLQNILGRPATIEDLTKAEASRVISSFNKPSQ